MMTLFELNVWYPSKKPFSDAGFGIMSVENIRTTLSFRQSYFMLKPAIDLMSPA